jgi:hypothetical protein
VTLRGNGNVAFYCFIVALGLKINNHEILAQMFNEELAVLSDPNEYYTGKHKNNFLAALNLNDSICDHPVRCKINRLGHHNGLFTQLSLWSAFLITTLKIESCDVCVFKRSSILREGGILNYVVDGDNLSSMCLLCADCILDVSITHPRDFHYPTHLAPGSPSAPIGREVGTHVGTTICPLKQLYRWLIKLMDVAFYNYHYRIHVVYLRIYRPLSGIATCYLDTVT